MIETTARMRALALVAGVVVIAVLAVASAAPVLAHGNHATVHPQVSADGTIRVAQVFLTEDGYLVVHRDDDGQPGEVVGHRRLAAGRYTDRSVRIESGVWEALSGNVTLWVTLHADDGDDQFEPGEDALLYWFGDPAGGRVTVGKREAATAIVTRPGGPLDDGAVPVERAVLGQRGHVVAHVDNGSLGAVVGTRTLAAGNHTNVRVPVSVPENGSQQLRVVAYADDGDGTFDDGDGTFDDGDGTFDDGDRPIHVGGELVASSYAVGRPNATLPSGNGTATAGVRTPTAGVRTPSETPAGRTAGDDSDRTGDQQSSESTGTAGAGPGFGVVAAVLGLCALVVARCRR